MSPKLLFFCTCLLSFIGLNGQTLEWAKRIGGGLSDRSTRSAVDQNGNLYLVGSFQGSNVDFDPGPGIFALTSAGAKDGFIAKYSADGIFRWAFRVGGNDQDDVEDVTVDKSGHIVITGYFRGNAVDFDPSSNTTNLNSYGQNGGDPGFGGDIFVAKYDTLGAFKWAFNVGGTQLGDDGTCITTDQNNNILVAGYFQTTIDFDPSAATNNLNSSNGVIFIAKYNPNGQYVWAINTGQGFSDNSAYGIGADAQNNVFVTGYFQGTNIDFDPSPTSSALLTSGGGFDVFVAKYNPNGQYQWAKKAGGSGTDVGRDLTVDGNNDVYIMGDYSSATVNFNGGIAANTFTNNGSNDLFVAKFSTAGQHLWSFATGSAGDEVALGVSVDGSNNIVATGVLAGTNVDFDPSPNTIALTSQGDADVFAVKYSPTGNYLCSFIVGGPTVEIPRAINAIGDDIYINGFFNGSNIDFDPTVNSVTLTSSGDDAFFAKYDWTIIPPAGGITGTSNCVTGQSQLTFTATTGAGPFTLYISNGTTTTAFPNIQSGVPFAITPPAGVSTTYTLTGIKDANACSAVTPANSVVVINPSSIPITTSGNAALCKGDSVQLSASGGATYQWSPAVGLSNPTIANPKASPAATTTYKVVVTNGAGCKDSTTLTVTLKPQPTIGVTPAAASFCPGDSVQLAATGGTLYQWTPATGLSSATIANPKAAPPATTTYWLTVTTADGCRDSIQKLVTRNAAPMAAVTTAAPICAGDTTQLTASGGTTYVWSPAMGLSNATIPNPRAFPAVTTTYQVVVISGQGCRDSAQTTVTIKAKPVITTSGSASVCRGDSAQLSATGGSTYQWSPTIGLSNPTIASPKASPSVTTRYRVRVTGADGCSDTASLTVTVNAPPTIVVNPAAPAFCPGDSVQLSATGGTLYQWSPVAGLSNPAIANPKASPAITTTYKLVVVDANGCRDSTTKTVTRNNAPVITVNAVPTSICPGDSTQLSATGGASYVWSPAATLNSAFIASPKAAPGSTTIYKVVVTNAAGCKDSATTTVQVKPIPVITITAAPPICMGDSAQLLATGGVAYQWSPATSLNNSSNSNPKASPTATTTYTVVVTGANGCRDSATTVLTVNNPPVLTVTNNTAVCAGDSVQLTANGGSSYQWSPSAGLSNAAIASPKASPGSTTTYQVIASTAAGCKDSARVTVTVKPKPVIVTSPAITICSGDTTQLSASGGTGYTWAPASTLLNPATASPFAFPVGTTTYTVTVTADGCINAASTTVTVRPKPMPALGKDTAICLRDGIVLDATTTTATGYLWSTGATTPTIELTNTGTYSVVVSVSGCNTPAVDTIVVTDLPKPALSLRKDTTICSFYSLQINASGEGIADWLWSTGSTDSFILVNDAGLYTVTAGNRCGDTTASVIIATEVCAEDLFFPTAFTPNGDGRNDRMQAGYFQGYQVYGYELMIFNRWGEMVFSTKDVNKGWDGVYKGKAQPTGVFVWLAKWSKTQDGAQIMRKGSTTLIR